MEITCDSCQIISSPDPKHQVFLNFVQVWRPFTFFCDVFCVVRALETEDAVMEVVVTTALDTYEKKKAETYKERDKRQIK